MSPYEVKCPTCGAGIQQFCRHNGIAIDTHPARWDARLDQALNERDKAQT